MTSNPKPRRRWFRYSLRMLFVLVTLFCVWLGVQVHIVRERKSLLEQANGPWEPTPFTSIRSSSISSDEFTQKAPKGIVLTNGQRVMDRTSIPFWRGLLGDQAFVVIVLANADEAKEKKVRRYFPEATVINAGAGPPVILTPHDPLNSRAKRP